MVETIVGTVSTNLLWLEDNTKNNNNWTVNPLTGIVKYKKQNNSETRAISEGKESIILNSKFKVKEYGNYTLTGTPKPNNDTAKGYLEIKENDKEEVSKILSEEEYKDKGDGVSFYLNPQHTYTVSAYINDENENEEVTFKPLIKFTSVEDDNFTPYTMSIAEELALIRTTIGGYKRNLLDKNSKLGDKVTMDSTGKLSYKNGNNQGQITLYDFSEKGLVFEKDVALFFSGLPANSEVKIEFKNATNIAKIESGHIIPSGFTIEKILLHSTNGNITEFSNLEMQLQYTDIIDNSFSYTPTTIWEVIEKQNQQITEIEEAVKNGIGGNTISNRQFNNKDITVIAEKTNFNQDNEDEYKVPADKGGEKNATVSRPLFPL